MNEQQWLASDDVTRMLGIATGRLTETDAMPPAGFRLNPRKLRLFAVACCRQVWHLLIDDAPCSYCSGSGRRQIAGLWDECGICHRGRINRSRRAVEVAERYADGLATGQEMFAAQTFPGGTSAGPALAVQPEPWHYWKVDPMPPPAAQAALLRDIAGNPWRPVTFDYGHCALTTPTVLALATAAYENGAGRKCERCKGRRGKKPTGRVWSFQKGRRGQWVMCPDCHGTGRVDDGTLDADRLAVLADALEEAGCPCSSEEACVHCQGKGFHETGLVKCDIDGIHDSRQKIGCIACNGDGCTPNPLLAHLSSDGPHVRGCWAVDLILGKGVIS